MLKFIKTTALGGVIFLIPVVFLVAVLGKAFTIVNKLAAPLVEHLPVETIAGVAVMHLVSVVILVLLCFLAGLAARTPRASALVEALEDNVLQKIPGYALLKAKSGSVLNPAETDKLKPVLVRFDDSWQVAYEVEAVESGKVLVFLPGAPDSWSGSVCAVDRERITPLDTNVKSVGQMMKRLGKGSAEVIHVYGD